jgi:hypothetical protein
VANSVSEKFNSLMPAVLDRTDEIYRAWVGDEDTDEGALTNEFKTVTDFINYYTRTQRVDESETNLLEFIVKIFSGLHRNYSEPDDYLRLRYKALVERKRTTHWNGKISIKKVFTYFFEEKNIYLIEQYPVNNLIVNGEFENLEGWTYNQADTEFRIIYSWSFEGGTAILINPSKENPTGYMEQQIAAASAGVYELLFFYSSPKGKNGDVLFSIRDGSGKYWNGTAWVSGEYLFHEIHNDIPGYYKAVQKTVKIPSITNITIRFKNKNGTGVLVDSVRFGKVVDPAIRLYITADPELFYNYEIKFDKKYIYNGFREYYIQTDMESILKMIHPAGVYAEMSILSSRLSIPWDRITIDWSAIIKLNWHVIHDSTRAYNSGSITFRNLYFDNTLKFNEAYNFDSKEIIRNVGPNDLTYREALSSHTRKYKYNKIIRPTRQLYFNGHIGFNSKYKYSGLTMGASVSFVTMNVKKQVMNQGTAQAVFDSLWNFGGGINFGGQYTTYQPGFEIYPVREV